MNAETRQLPLTYAAIVFSGKTLNPETVTSIIGKNPTLSYASGSNYIIKGVKRTRKTSVWVYSTRNILKSDSLTMHLDVIEEILIGATAIWPNTHIRKIKELVEAQDVKLRIDIFWYGAENAEPPKISRSFDQVVTMAGGSVATDFHKDGDEVVAA